MSGENGNGGNGAAAGRRGGNGGGAKLTLQTTGLLLSVAFNLILGLTLFRAFAIDANDRKQDVVLERLAGQVEGLRDDVVDLKALLRAHMGLTGGGGGGGGR